jgi:cold shock CspA family protein
MRYQGKITQWFDDKGYGFIITEAENKRVFLHISAIPKGQIRPEVGEILTFDVVDHAKGPQASNVFFPERPVLIRSDSEYKASLHDKNISNPAPIRLKAKTIERASASGYLGSAKTQKRPRDFKTLIYMVLFGWLIMTAYNAWEASSTKTAQVNASSANQLSKQSPELVNDKTFQCDGKIYCSEMGSCAEAKFYLRNCTGTMMDGDNDGVPCESQWCK